jgi:hypothetical protein
MSQPPRPPPWPEPPWGTLIASARAGRSIRKLARHAGISEGRWRQVEAGCQAVSPGVYVRAGYTPLAADTIARMALAAGGVTAAQMRTAGCRPDAAVIMEAAGDTEGDILRRVQEMSPAQAQDLLAAIAEQLGAAPAPPADEHRYGT